MQLRHVALTYSSETNSDRFCRDLLGLSKSEPKVLPADLSRQIFGLGAELRIINYTGEGLHFEVFLTDQIGDREGRIDHLCLEVEDLSALVDKCRRLGVKVDEIPKGDKTLTFIEDGDGNLFEVSEG